MLTRKFFEEGFQASLKSINSDTHPVSSLIAQYILRVVTIGQRIQLTMLPHLKGMEYNSLDLDLNLPIRCIKWHPNHFKIAVAASDDSIRVYGIKGNIVPILKIGSGLQKGVSCMSWRPFSASDLAVGCLNGILIWTLDPNSHITRPITQAQQLTDVNRKHLSIASVEWSPNGCYLATTSKISSDISIWDVDKNICVPLKCVGPSCNELSWSLDGLKLCCTTRGNILRVLNTETWLPEKWTVPTGMVMSAVWSSCGQFLLFVTSDDSYLYSISFVDDQLFTGECFFCLPKSLQRLNQNSSIFQLLTHQNVQYL